MSFTTCAYCPRLCRHVCPVSVATNREAATPTAMMGVPLLQNLPPEAADLGIAGTSLCMGCGACTAHCKWHVPVADHLRTWRREQGVEIPVAPLSPILGDAPRVALLTTERDWSGAWTAQHGERLSIMHSHDELGFSAWKAGHPDVIPKVAAHFHRRSVITSSLLVAELLRAAEVPVQVLEAPAGARFMCCQEGFSAGPGQLACCGRREGFPDREPEAASAVAIRNAKILGDGEYACADQGCADWLKRWGAQVKGPEEAWE